MNWMVILQITSTVILALCLWILNSLSNRIKQLEDWKVDKGHLRTELQVVDEKFKGIEQRIIDARDFNMTDHTRIEKRIVSMQTSIDEIKDCVNKIANNREC